MLSKVIKFFVIVVVVTLATLTAARLVNLSNNRVTYSLEVLHVFLILVFIGIII
jgi:hypothetical protein